MNSQYTKPFQPKFVLMTITFCFLSSVYFPLASAESVDAEQTMLNADEQGNVVAAPVQDDSMQSNNNKEPAMAETSGISPPIEDATMTEAEIPTEDNPTAVIAEQETAMPDSSEVRYTSISEIPGNYYAVQVVATSSMRNLDAFAQKHQLSNNLSTQIVVRGKTWNVLLSGAYPTRREAKAAVADFGSRLSTSPWIRPVSSLQ